MRFFDNLVWLMFWATVYIQVDPTANQIIAFMQLTNPLRLLSRCSLGKLKVQIHATHCCYIYVIRLK